jgi:hypothetical protein
MREHDQKIAAGALTGVTEDKIAYIKHTIVEGAPVFTVFSSDGDELATFGNRDTAVAVVLQNDLVPVSVH